MTCASGFRVSLAALLLVFSAAVRAGEPKAKQGHNAAADAEAAAKKHAVDALYDHVQKSVVKYGLKDPRTELLPTKCHPFGKWMHVNLSQVYEGLPVFPADLAAQVEPDGTVHVIADTIVRDLSIPTIVPKVTAPEAEQIALKSARLLTAEEVQRELLVWCEEQTSHGKQQCVLAWRVTVDDGRQGGVYWQYVIDASSGRVIRGEDMKKHASTSGARLTTLKTMYAGTYFIDCYFSGRTQYLQSPWYGTGFPSDASTARSGCFASNAKQSTRNSTIVSNSTNSFGNGALGLDVQTMGADAFVGMEMTLEAIRNAHGRDNLDGANAWRVDARVNYPSNTAGWVGGRCKCLELGIGDASTWPYVSTDIVGHELGHGLQEGLGVLSGTNGETRALQEGYADILATEVFVGRHRRIGDPIQTGDYWIGPAVFKANYQNNTYAPTVALRYMDDPQKTDPTIPACWSAGIGALVAHRATLPFDHMYYLLANGGTSKCNGNTVLGIPREEVWQIAYLALTSSTAANVTYQQTRALWINAANALYGTFYGGLVDQAFTAIGVP